mgnify:CR=1 FL=1
MEKKNRDKGPPEEKEIPVGMEDLAGGGTLSVLSRAEIDVQITTAKRYPRSVTAFKREAEEMATLDEETAGSMFYVLPRAGKNIEGPSVRLAEIVGSAWGNLRYEARVVDVGERHIAAQGTAFDLEKNIAARVEVRRRITDKRGKRYNDDMIGVTANAACSIALRQAIFKVVPFAYVKDIYEKAREVSVGKGLTMEQRRGRALEWFSKAGAKQADVLKLLARKGVEDITVDDLILLQGLKTAIQDNETTWDAIMEEKFALSEQDAMPRAIEEIADRRPPAKTDAGADPAPPSTLPPPPDDVPKFRLTPEGPVEMK